MLDDDYRIERLRDLDNLLVTLEWQESLPEADMRGVRSVTNDYQPFHKATVSKVGIAGNMFSFKARKMTPFHSHIEESLLLYFEMHPLVVEVRSQYVLWDGEQLAEYEAINRRLRRTDLMTVDFNLTIKIPGRQSLLYHVVSAKLDRKVEDTKTLNRHLDEIDALSPYGISHEVMTGNSVSRTEFLNLQRLHERMSFVRVEDIQELRLPAAYFANALRTSNISGPLQRIISMIARREELTANEGFVYFSLANFFGFIRWNHTRLMRNALSMEIERFNINPLEISCKNHPIEFMKWPHCRAPF